MSEYKISLLLPTRGRASALRRSILSAVQTADDIDSFQIMIGFDNDDIKTIDYFVKELQPELDDLGVNYQAHVFEPMGYIRLNEYVNGLAKHSDADWLVFWNDDAIMETHGWDTIIDGYTGQFKVLAFHTHNGHPYSIFPIVPKAWFTLFGYLSPHQISDAWISQQAYCLDIWERIEVDVTHDRFDLTGNNKDEIFEKRPMLEGNPKNPRDFHSKIWYDKRFNDLRKLITYMDTNGLDTTFVRSVFAGKQDPWEKLKNNDVNSQVSQWKPMWGKII
jgi:hypothetical protein|tara:strand:+ start:2258 stop:3085 length:828 start_codon:yes stop_codon:yes gene_type:complete